MLKKFAFILRRIWLVRRNPPHLIISQTWPSPNAIKNRMKKRSLLKGGFHCWFVRTASSLGTWRPTRLPTTPSHRVIYCCAVGTWSPAILLIASTVRQGWTKYTGVPFIGWFYLWNESSGGIGCSELVQKFRMPAETARRGAGVKTYSSTNTSHYSNVFELRLVLSRNQEVVDEINSFRSIAFAL